MAIIIEQITHSLGGRFGSYLFVLIATDAMRQRVSPVSTSCREEAALMDAYGPFSFLHCCCCSVVLRNFQYVCDVLSRDRSGGTWWIVRER